MSLSTTDRLDIAELLSRFAKGIDSCNWGLYRSVFTAEIDVDYSSWRAESIGHFRADEWVARGRRLFPGLDASQHSLTNLIISSVGSYAADLTVHVRADHILQNSGGDPRFTCTGYYSDHVVRTPAGWLIATKKLTVQWTEGNRDIMRIAAERAAALHTESQPL